MHNINFISEIMLTQVVGYTCFVSKRRGTHSRYRPVRGLSRFLSYVCALHLCYSSSSLPGIVFLLTQNSSYFLDSYCRKRALEWNNSLSRAHSATGLSPVPNLQPSTRCITTSTMPSAVVRVPQHYWENQWSSGVDKGERWDTGKASPAVQKLLEDGEMVL